MITEARSQKQISPNTFKTLAKRSQAIKNILMAIIKHLFLSQKLVKKKIHKEHPTCTRYLPDNNIK